MRAWSLFLLGAALAASAQAQEPGVSAALARDRAGRVSNLRYEISFFIPREKTSVVTGRETVTFTLGDASRPLLLDFEPASPRARAHGRRHARRPARRRRTCRASGGSAPSRRQPRRAGVRRRRRAAQPQRRLRLHDLRAGAGA